jgi:predicted N-formylglutamate amidohydrolase
LLLTCEHAGHRIPKRYAPLFHGAEDVLVSHRGWDPGALDFIRGLSRRLAVPFHHVVWSRLLVEANRTPSNPRIWSRFTRNMSAAEKAVILETYWWPHRRAVEGAVRQAIGQGKPVLHIAVHSFTPVLDGETRNAELALLYDSARPVEQALCRGWQGLLNEYAPEFRVRRNYPYRGRSDGLTTWLRRKFPARAYVGVELEVNQALIGTPAFSRAISAVADSVLSLTH